MPYKTIGELPDNLSKLPEHAKEIYLKAFNSAIEKNEEPQSHAIAWSAVEKSFKKENGKWVAKEAVHPPGEHICVCSKCGEEITVEQNVKCNTQKCPECGGLMTAKMAGENRESSDIDKRDALYTALTSYYGVAKEAEPRPASIDIEEVFDDALIYKIDGQSYRMAYSMNENGTPEFGEPEKVVAQKVYKPLESLQTLYSEIIQEKGKRNAMKDSTRIKKIMELCQELLDTEDLDTDKLKKAVSEAKAVLKLVKEQPMIKTEEGVQYPQEAYAYTPGDSKDWRLRLWESVEKGVTKFQLNKVSTMLCDGGYKGHKVTIPVSEVSGVKRRIRDEYRKLGLDDDISKWVREVETREKLVDWMPLTEAKFDKGRATVIVIKPGFNATEDRYYPAEMLKRDYKVFEGHKMYADHPTEAEDEARPERSIKDWVATLSEVMVDENGVVTGVAEIVEPWLMTKLASLRDKGMLSEMGISINAVGSASKGKIEGKDTLIIEKLVAARSVDFVTEPGAGGIVTMYESDRQKDIDLVDLSTLREKRPDLVKSLESEVRLEIHKEVKKTMEAEDRIKELEEENSTLTTKVSELETKEAEATKEKAKADASAIVKEAVEKAELPEAAKAKLLERFKDVESAEGIEEAITAEKDYIAKLSETNKVVGMGKTKHDPEKSHTELKESWKALHPEWSDEQIETAINGK